MANKADKKEAVKNPSVLKWVISIITGVKWAVLVLTLIQVIFSGLSVANAWVFRGMIDRAVGHDRHGLYTYAILLVSILLTNIALHALMRFTNEYTVCSIENRIKSRLFSNLMHKEYGKVASLHTGEWMNRIDKDSSIVTNGIVSILPNLVGMFVRLIGSAWMLITLVPEVAWLIFPSGALLVVLTYTFRKKMKVFHKNQRKADDKTNVFMLERLSNLLVVHSFSKEDETDVQSDAYLAEYFKQFMKRCNYSNVCNTGFSLVMNGAYILGAVYCGFRLFYDTMSYGTVFAVLQLIGQVQSPFANVTGYIPRYYSMMASAERIMEAEQWRDDNTESVVSGDQITELYKNGFDGISFCNVCFTYPDDSGRRTVINNLDLNIQKGEFVAVTGISGCGKSTILKLMMSLYDIDSGSKTIRFFGKEEQLTAKWRGLYAYVPQGNQLMSGTIRQVVAFGDNVKAADDDGLFKALETACASEFVKALPNGLDTVLGEQGKGLSEGQMQRLAIARAIFSDHPIILLDEATSSLDEKTEINLLNNIRKLTDCTVLIVTHRAAALNVCDREIQISENGICVRNLNGGK